MVVTRGLRFAALVAGAAAFDFANPKVSSCVAAREAAWEGNSWLNTANANSYMCTKAQIDAHYDPANLACWQSDPQGPTGDIASGSCPAGQTVRCLMQAGWGKWAAIRTQLLTALGAALGAVVGVATGETKAHLLLNFTAGGFIYVATVDVLPQLLRG